MTFNQFSDFSYHPHPLPDIAIWLTPPYAGALLGVNRHRFLTFSKNEFHFNELCQLHQKVRLNLRHIQQSSSSMRSKIPYMNVTLNNVEYIQKRDRLPDFSSPQTRHATEVPHLKKPLPPSRVYAILV